MNIKKSRKKYSNILIFSIAIIIFIITIDGTNSCQKSKSTAGADKIIIAATIYPLYDIAKNIVGSKGEVYYLINPGESPHTFEFTPGRVKKIHDADIAIKIGLGFDDWINDSIKSIGTTLDIYAVNKRIELIDGNPHIWLSLTNGQIISENLCNVLVKEFPEYSEDFRENCASYIQKLESLNSSYKEEAKNFSKKEFIAFHDAWSYFSKDLGIKQVMAIEPFPGKEPTPEHLIEIQKTIKEYNIDTVFIEPQLSPEIVEFLAEDMDLEILILDPLGGIEGRQTYIKLMAFNFNQFRKTLK